jgi:hypothetical protein
MRKAPSLPGPGFALGLSASLLAASLTGCLLASSEDGDGRPVPDPVEQPPVPPGPVPSPLPSGTYRMTSQIDLTVEGVLPEPAAQMVATLRDFSTQPAHTLLDLADEAGVPAVAELRAALPDALESRLEGWIDEEIAKLEISGVPVTTLAGGLASASEQALTRMELQSELVLGDGGATHRLTKVSTLAGSRWLGSLPDEVVRASAAMTASPTLLTLGDHQFGIAYGTYVWSAMEEVSSWLSGGSLRSTLGAGVNCPALAARIADKCVLGVCIGHTAALTQICERGLDEVVDRARTKVSAIRFTALRLASGSATPSDHASSLSGDWNAELDAGMGLRHAPATFSARR